VAIVTRDGLREKLLRWQNGRLSHQQMYDWANEVTAENGETGDEVVDEIVSHLDVLDVNLTTPDDVPTFIAMLDAETDEEALAILEAYGQAFDLEQRIARWKDDPFYAPFCRTPGRAP